jgi:ketosteroid isomerase-like protein
MSQENVEIARRMIRAFEERDTDALLECTDADCELLLPRNLIEGGSYKGHEGVRQALADAFDTWESINFEVHDVRATDDGAVVLSRTTNVGKGETPTIESEFGYLFRLRRNKITYMRSYLTPREALEAAGLRE